MNQYPSNLIFDVRDDYRDFITAVSDTSLPTIDEDAVLSRMIDAIRHKSSSTAELFYVRQEMSNGEGLVEKTVVEDMNNVYYFQEEANQLREGLEVVANAAKKIAEQLQQQIIRHGLYEDDYFNYEYRGVFNNGNIILERCG
jgi:hypothetical protein